SASAETTWQVLQRFGLTGAWSGACNAPSTRSNFFEIYRRDENGLARRDVDRGAQIPIATSFVESAEIISPNTLKVRIRNADKNWEQLNNLTYDVVFIKEDDPRTKEIFRFRGLESVASDGRVLAKGGIRSDGKPTFWEYKCRPAM